MINKVMLTMESRIHGDMYVRFGGRLVETYHRKVEKRCWPSLLKEIADVCGVKKNLTFHLASHSKFFYLLNISELSILKNVTANDLETSYILFLSQLCNIQRTL